MPEFIAAYLKIRYKWEDNDILPDSKQSYLFLKLAYVKTFWIKWKENLAKTDWKCQITGFETEFDGFGFEEVTQQF